MLPFQDADGENPGPLGIPAEFIGRRSLDAGEYDADAY